MKAHFRRKSAFLLRLAALFVLTVSAVAHAQFTYVTNYGTITVTGYSGPGGEVIIPDAVGGLPVTAIGEQAFSHNENLVSIEIPDTVINLGDYGFCLCPRLARVILGNGVRGTGDFAFYGCSSLTNVVIGDSVSSIGRYAFMLCSSLANFVVPDGVGRIEDFAFRDCYNLTNITLGAGVTSIGAYAFSPCPSLTAIMIPASVTSIGELAFGGCYRLLTFSVDGSNLSYADVDGVLFSKDRIALVQYPPGRTGDYSVPVNTTFIGKYAFAAIGHLTDVTLPATINFIGDSAFFNCNDLEAVHFLGNAPYHGRGLFGPDLIIVYYLPGTTGWGPTFDGFPTMLWLPKVSTDPATFGIHNNQFSFAINWASGMATVVEGSSSLADPAWLPIATNIISTDGSAQFSDANWTGYQARFYRVRWQ